MLCDASAQNTVVVLCDFNISVNITYFKCWKFIVDTDMKPKTEISNRRDITDSEMCVIELNDVKTRVCNLRQTA